jgi:hypothetical protein
MDSEAQDSIIISGHQSITESNLVDKIVGECNEEWSSTILVNEDRAACCTE